MSRHSPASAGYTILLPSTLPPPTQDTLTDNDWCQKAPQVVGDVPHAPVGPALRSSKPGGQDCCTGGCADTLETDNRQKANKKSMQYVTHWHWPNNAADCPHHAFVFFPATAVLCLKASAGLSHLL